MRTAHEERKARASFLRKWERLGHEAAALDLIRAPAHDPAVREEIERGLRFGVTPVQCCRAWLRGYDEETRLEALGL